MHHAYGNLVHYNRTRSIANIYGEASGRYITMKESDKSQSCPLRVAESEPKPSAHVPGGPDNLEILLYVGIVPFFLILYACP